MLQTSNWSSLYRPTHFGAALLRLLTRVSCRYDLVALNSLDEWTPECEEKVACGVGAIPSFEPVTDAERNVYALARRVFSGQNALGERRRFLEMCYKVSSAMLGRDVRCLEGS